MHSDWLYVLNSKSGTRFFDDDGKDIGDTSFKTLQKLITMKGPFEWYISRNFKKIEPGDRLWIYYGTSDDNLGVVAVGRIVKFPSEGTSGSPAAIFEFDTPATTRLFAKPVPAPTVREYVPKPIANAWGLDKHPELVRLLETAANL